MATGVGEQESGFFGRILDRTKKMMRIEAPDEASAAFAMADNSPKLVISDMANRNDAPLRGFERFTSGWYVGPGHTQLGNDPRLKNGGKWFLDSYGHQFDLEQHMTAIMPWVVIADGEKHQATNVQVQLANVKLFLLQGSTEKWVSLGSSRGVGGDFYFKPDLTRSSGLRKLRVKEDGSVAIGFPESRELVFHGWWTKGRIPIPFAPTDIRAVFVTMEGRLIQADPSLPDDRSEASLLMQIGADYYRSEDIPWAGVPAPAIVSSRFKLVTEKWQPISAMTFNDVGRTEPPGLRGISVDEFLENPPPL